MGIKPPATLSAIIPFYGDPTAAMPLLDALSDQSNPPLQVIVVDDASPTPFPERPGTLAARRTSNGGFGAAVNTGAQLAAGDYLVILNSDLTISATFFENLTSAIAGRDVVASPLVTEGGLPANVGRRWPSVARIFFSWLTPLARWRDQPVWRKLVGHCEQGTAEKGIDWVVGACLIVPTAPFREVGGFDERFHMNSEEVDLQRRLRAIGVPAIVLPEVRVEHVSGGSSDPLYRRQWLVDGWFRYQHKWGGARRLLLALLLASAINFGWNVLRRLRNSKVAPVATLREETGLIRGGWRARRGKPVRP